jgi:hypothetical protein
MPAPQASSPMLQPQAAGDSVWRTVEEGMKEAGRQERIR